MHYWCPENAKKHSILEKRYTLMQYVSRWTRTHCSSVLTHIYFGYIHGNRQSSQRSCDMNNTVGEQCCLENECSITQYNEYNMYHHLRRQWNNWDSSLRNRITPNMTRALFWTVPLLFARCLIISSYICFFCNWWAWSWYL